MRKVIRKFIVWVMGASDHKGAMVSNPIEVGLDSGSGLAAEAKIRLGIVKAMNGTLIEVATHKHNPHGPDWKHEVYIVREGDDLGDALKTVLAIKTLEK